MDPASVPHYDKALNTVSVLIQAGADVDARDETESYNQSAL